MRLSCVSKILGPCVLLGVGLVAPACAQSDRSVSASESMKAAGESMEKAGSDAAKGAEYAYRGTAIAIRDSKITLKVKSALHEDTATKNSDIHVSTSAGIVTLKGDVASIDVARHAAQLAQNTEGVKDVKNEIKVSGASASE